MSWLVDTLVVTGALIALVLVLRGPVTRQFGPGMAYALWVLPLLRLVLPPLQLPAPSAPVAAAAPSPAVELVTAVAAPAQTSLTQGEVLPWLQVIWLAGAAAFLVWRTWQYAAMRHQLLADAREVGRSGKVRLIEGPGVTSPVAFGVFDKVIALPLGFIDRPDQTGRDLAIAHELEHHAGRDLAVNILVQPLLALHWFNPLAWLGWRALRRDQEAACDARVLSGASLATRETYARLIASFARTPHPMLAAPLACPVLREKTIIHRLRSLTMTEPSPRRRNTGKALIAAAVLALPLTATISYAANDAPQATTPDTKPTMRKEIVIVGKSGEADPAESKLKTTVIERGGKTIVLNTDKELSPTEIEAEIAKAEQSMAKAETEVLMLGRDDKGGPSSQRKKIMIFRGDDGAAIAKELDGSAIVLAGCEGKGPATEIAEQSAKDGKVEEIHLRFCNRGEAHADAKSHALTALKEARANFDANKELSDEMRKKVIERLDAKIAELSKQG